MVKVGHGLGADESKCKFQADITRLRGILFGIIKQMQHLCGVANMVVYPSGDKAPSGDAIMLATPQRCCIYLMAYLS